MRTRTRYLSRQELYQLVWAEPTTVVSKRLGMSDVGLAKACRRASVPVPERGYWAKLKAGKSVIQPPLPPRGIGMPDQTDVLVDSSTESGSEACVDQPPSPPSFPEDISSVADRVREMVGKVAISRTLAKPHPLIKRLLDRDEERRHLFKNSPYEWNKPLYDSAIERRRLRLLNALFLALARCDARPSFNNRDNARECEVQIGYQRINFVLEPVATRSRRGKSESGKETPQRLQLKHRTWEQGTEAWKSWEDGDSATLEEQIEDVAVNLIVAGEAQHREAVRRHYEWQLEMKRREEEEERQRKAEEERREKERIAKEQKARVDRLLGEAMALRQATDIRAYVKTVLAVHTNAEDQAVRERVKAWSVWALAEADRIDPIKSLSFLKRL